MGLRISIFVLKKILVCMGLTHTKVGFNKLIHVAPISVSNLGFKLGVRTRRKVIVYKKKQKKDLLFFYIL